MIGLGLKLARLRGPSRQGGPPAPPAYTANAVNFDATNDYLTRGAALTGTADNATLLISLWFQLQGSDGVLMRVLDTTGNKVRIIRGSDDKLALLVLNTASINIWGFKVDALHTTAINPGWNHILIAANLVATPVGQIYINDAVAAITESTVPTTGTIDWSATDWGIGAQPTGDSKFDGDMADVYMSNEYLDIDIEANRRKFIDASGKPVDLGSDGSDPTGTAPLVFFSQATSDWHTNKGSGGGFTENGALTDAANSPSD